MFKLCDSYHWDHCKILPNICFDLALM